MDATRFIMTGSTVARMSYALTPARCVSCCSAKANENENPRRSTHTHTQPSRLDVGVEGFGGGIVMKDCGACFEQGPLTYSGGKRQHGKSCRDYARQRVWNKKMQTLLGREPEEAPIPKAPSYTEAELERWAVGQATTPKYHPRGFGFDTEPNLWWRETWALLQTDGRAYKHFIKACKKGAPDESL
jgi:hypothetical protein